MKTLYWVRRDLRINDNRALADTAKSGEVYPIFILPEGLGGASKWWLHHSLDALQKEYGRRGIQLGLFVGKPETVIPQLCESLSISKVVWNRWYTPTGIAEGQSVKQELDRMQVRHLSFNSQLLIEPSRVLTKQGTPFKVFTPFWRHCRQFLKSQNSEESINFKTQSVSLVECGSSKLDDYNLLPTRPNWASQFSEYWQPGENSAHKRFESFLNANVDDYGKGRDFPALAKTSRLSPHLAWGEISAGHIFTQTTNAIAAGAANSENANKFLSEIGWREFCSYLLYHFPHITERAFNPAFNNFSWESNDALLRAWQKGVTGYPLVDAGMRELWHTGYMHNRVRMVVASFLTKHLLQNWKEGADWFWDTLLDADLGNNTAGWQWAAGCGADAAPFFRIFNPTLQGEKFDVNGDYLKQWVPELSDLPNKWLFNPSGAPERVLVEAGVKLGQNYPYPIVDHKEARELALSSYQAMKDFNSRA